MAHAKTATREVRSVSVFVLLFVLLFLLHLGLLRLPYFWDEAGHYVPAARDLLLTGSLIPHSTPSNAHPPLVMAYLALWWKAVGYTLIVTRTAMLFVASFALLGVFRLARRAANVEVAIAATICTALYPVFFVQSSLAHVDLAAAGLTFWGLLAYVENRRIATVLWFSLAVLAKETAVLAPLSLFAWELLRPFLRIRDGSEWRRMFLRRRWNSTLLLVSLAPLLLWYWFHYSRTGFVFGNPEFFRYNVQATLHPLRVLLALLMRLWQTFGYLNLWMLTLAALLAMWKPPLYDANGERPRIALETQLAFFFVTAPYVFTMAFIGGAVLARYMLPIVPLVIIVWVSTLWRRVGQWRAVVAIVAGAFAIGLFVNPPYGFSFEDTLAYRDYIVLHQHADAFIEARCPMARVLTAWPANDELTRPYLAYVTRPVRVVRIEDFSAEQVMSAAEARSEFDVALVFSTKYEPPRPLVRRWPAWDEMKMRFFGYHRDLPPLVAAQMLDGEIVFSEARNGQWVSVIELHHIVNASRHSVFPNGL